jgi:hypothetical protein
VVEVEAVVAAYCYVISEHSLKKKILKHRQNYKVRPEREIS